MIKTGHASNITSQADNALGNQQQAGWEFNIGILKISQGIATKKKPRNTKLFFLAVIFLAMVLVASPLIARINGAPLVLYFGSLDKTGWIVYDPLGSTPDTNQAVADENVVADSNVGVDNNELSGQNALPVVSDVNESATVPDDNLPVKDSQSDSGALIQADSDLTAQDENQQTDFNASVPPVVTGENDSSLAVDGNEIKNMGVDVNIASSLAVSDSEKDAVEVDANIFSVEITGQGKKNGSFKVMRKKNGRYDLNLFSSADGQLEKAAVEIVGLESLPDRVDSSAGDYFGKGMKDGKISTPVVAVKQKMAFDEAIVTLPKNGAVNTIVKCEEFNFDSFDCQNWEKTDIPFEETADSITFKVGGFSAYGGAFIEVTKAEHLDENRDFISDIYGKVKARDNVWSEAINPGEFVRVTFEKELNNSNDITLYARAGNPAKIEVYTENGTVPITSFENIQEDNKYKVFLTNIPEGEKYSTFDLRIMDNPVEFDYIVDPNATNIDMNIWRIDTNHSTKWPVNSTMPVFSYAADGNLTIDFNVASDTNFGYHYADINYSTSQTKGTGTSIITSLLVDGNRCQTNNIGAWNNTASSDANLTGYWKFDSQEDVNTIRAFDYSGNNRHGQYKGGADNNAQGKWDSNAGFFDGKDDWVDTGKALSNYISASVGSMSVWAYFLGKTGEAGGCSVGRGQMIIEDAFGYAWLGADQDNICAGAADGASINYSITTTYSANIWYHMVWVHTGGTLYFYLDGNLIGSKAVGDIGDITKTVQFGKDYQTANWFHGRIEELKTYNRALTAAEISQDFNYGMRNFRKCSWDWNISGVADANYYANVLIRDNASNTDYNSSNNNFEVNPTAAQNQTNIDTNIWRIDNNPTNSTMPTFSYTNDGNLTIDFNIASDANYTITYADLNYSTSQTQGTGTSIINSLKVDGNRCQTNFIGTWNNTPSSDSSLQGYWKFDAQEDDYNTIRAFDYSGNGNHGQYLNGADNNATGKWDTNAAFFDGVNDYIGIKDNDNLTIGANGFTTIATITPKTIPPESSYQRMWILSKFRSGELGAEYFLSINGEVSGYGKLVFVVANDDGTGNIRASSTTMVAGKTYHIAAVMANNSTATIPDIYINGQLDNGSIIQSDLSAIVNTTSPLEIGRLNYDGSAIENNWNGTIEELKIYNRALTAAEISQDYNYGKRNFRKCSWDWNISGVADANYYANTLIRDNASNTDYNSSNNNFEVNPTTAQNQTNIDTNIWRIDNNPTNSTMPTFSYTNDGNLTIDFNVASDSNYTVTYADLNYSTSKTQGTGTSIINSLLVDGNRCQTNMIGTWNNTPSSDSSLKGYYKFDAQDTNTSRVFDYSGNNFHGQYKNGAAGSAQGKWDTNAAYFDGSNDYVDLGKPLSSFMSNSTGSISVWVYFLAKNGTGGNCLLGLGGMIFEDADNLSASGGHVWLGSDSNALCAGGMDIGYATIMTPYNLNTWYHLVWVHSGGTLYLYLNGKLQDSKALGNIYDVTKTVDLGADSQGSAYLNARVEELKVYNRALSADEISLDYNFGKRNFRKCSWDWNISGVADANYYANILTRDNASNTDYNSSNNNFEVNPTAAQSQANIDTNIWRVDNWPTNSTMPTFNYNTDGNLTIDFNVASDSNYTVTYADLNYSTIQTQGTGTSIIDTLKVDGNRCQTNFIGTWNNTLNSDVNLVGYWKFDSQEDDYNNIRAFDYSGKGNNGEYYNGADNNAQGKWDTNAAFFDGINDIIVVPVNTSLQMTKALTITAWVKKRKNNEWNPIALKYGGTSNGFWFGYDNSNKVTLGFNDGTPANGTNTITDTDWHQIAGTYDGTYIKVYLDGNSNNTPFANADIIANDYPLRIGYDESNGLLFKGDIEELRIYDRALTANEISLDYNFGKRNFRKCSWDWNISGVADANYYANVLIRDNENNVGFNPSNNNFEVNAPAVIPPAPNLTNIDTNIWRVDNNPTNSTMPTFNYNIDGNLTIDFNVASDSNYTVTYADLNYSMTQTQGSGTSIVNSLLVDGNRCQTNLLGTWNNTAGSDSSLVGYWKFDAQEDVNTIRAFDYSGNNNHLQLINGADNNAQGKWDTNAGFFDGVNDYAEKHTQLISAYPFTISAWFQTTDTTAKDRNIASLTATASGSRIFAIGLDESHHAKMIAQNTTIREVTSANTVNDGQWHEVVGVFNTATDRKLYLDGAYQGNSTNSVTYYASVNSFDIGKASFATGVGFYKGVVDEVKLYNRALTSNEISLDYNFGARNFRKCSWDWNIMNVTDAYYYANILTRDNAGNADYNSSNNNFEVNAPLNLTNIDMNVWRVDNWSTNSTMPTFSYTNDGNLTIDFNVASDSNYTVTYADLNYSTSQTKGTGTSIITSLLVDGNRCQTNMIGTWDNTPSSDSSLKGYYKFDAQDTNTSRVFDFSGSNFHGQYKGGANGSMQGKWDTNAGYFNGTNGYVDLGKPTSSYMSASTGSISVWVYFISKTGSSFGCGMSIGGMILEDSDNFSTLGGHIWLGQDGNAMCAGGYDSGAWKAILTPYNINQWYYLDWVHSGGTLYLYVNGKLQASTALGNLSDITRTIDLGVDFQNATYLNARVEELKIYNRALTANEISLDYNFGKRNFRKCSWDWNIFGVADANYYANVLIRDAAGNTEYNSSDKNFEVNPGSPCSCPATGGWEITGGLVCRLSANCTMTSGNLHIGNGKLIIPNGLTLAVINGNRIILDNVATSQLIIESGGRLVINKSGA